MGEVKYQSMGIDYPLKGVAALSSEDAGKAKLIIFEGLKKRLIEEKQKA